MSASIAIVKQRGTNSSNNNNNNRADDLCTSSHSNDYHSKMISTSLGCSAIMTVTTDPNDCNNTNNANIITTDMTTAQPILMDGTATRYIRLKSFYAEHCIYLPAVRLIRMNMYTRIYTHASKCLLKYICFLFHFFPEKHQNDVFFHSVKDVGMVCVFCSSELLQ